MKPLNLFGFTLIFLLANLQILNAQCTQDITLSSQAAVDSFSVTYGCDIIEGTLTIAGDDITNLNGLSAIIYVKSLTIENNPLLKNLKGLEDIGEIYKELTINNNSNLLNIDAISVKKIEVGSLVIENNNALSHLPDFENVELYLDIIIKNNFALKTILIEGVSLDYDLLISENTSLTLILIKDTYLECGSFQINDNPNLTDIKTTGRLFTEICTAKIYNNNSLKNASIYMGQTSGLEVYDNPVLEKLRYIFDNGDVFINNNPALTDISMAGYLMYNLDIISNQSLENIGYFDIDEVVRLNISDNANLKNIDSLFNIEKITSNIKITNNSNLANCCLLPEWLDRIGVESENVNISQNKEGCNSIADIETSCNEVIDCDTEEPIILTTQAAVDKLTCEVINGDLIIDSENSNDPVTDLSALSGLTTIKGSLYIRNCYIENLNGLNAIINIKSLTIENNPQLQNLEGLENVSSIVELIIDNNPNLLNIDAISVKKIEVGSLVIENNNALSHLPDFENVQPYLDIIIKNNFALKTILIEGVSLNDDLLISENTSLTSILIKDTYLDCGSFRINDNPNLTDIKTTGRLFTEICTAKIYNNNSLKNAFIYLGQTSGLEVYDNPVLEKLRYIFDNGGAFISNNPALTDISMAGYFLYNLNIISNQSLESIGNIAVDDELKNLNISDNPNLKNIDSLFNIEKITSSINITNNSNLANCCLLPEWLDRIGAKSEKVDISQNKEGCNGIADIETSCTQPNFEDFPWLNDIVDLNNCCNNQTVTQYTNGTNSFIYIEAKRNCEKTENRLYSEGQLLCNSKGNFCIEDNRLQNFDTITLWTCDDEPINECFANAGTVLSNGNHDNCEYVRPIEAINTTDHKAYDYLFLLTNEGNDILEVSKTGDFTLEDNYGNYFGGGGYCFYGVSYLASEGLDWSNGNISNITNHLGNSIQNGACIDISNCISHYSWEDPKFEILNITCNRNKTFTVEFDINCSTCGSIWVWGDDFEGFKFGRKKTITFPTNKLNYTIKARESSDAGCVTEFEIKTPKECNENLPDFEDFPWLNDIVDLNDCCNNQTVTQYTNGVHSYIYIETSNNCENTKNRLYYEGQLFCNVENDFCVDAYNFQNFEAITLWNCKEEPIECMANAGSVVANNDDLCEGNSLFEPATIFDATENEAYDYLFLLTKEDGNILEVNFTGQFAMRDSNDNYFAADYYCVYGVSYLAVEGIDWREGNINELTNEIGISLEDGACFAISDCENYRYWAKPVVNEISTSCSENETFTVELNVSSTTWNSFEILYGENAENRHKVKADETFSLTLSANSLTHSVFVYDKSDARCETVYEVKTPKECNENLPNFEDFPWLNDIVNLNDCCNNQTVTQYTNGVHSYIYIETSNNCENTKNRLYYEGQLFCNVANDFCFDAYNLQNFEAITLWSYEEECIPDHEETKPNFEDFPWLNDIVDLDDCCNNQTVTQYTNGVHSYIYIETSNNCENKKNRLYYEGQLFCNVENDFCVDAYNFQNFEAITLWSCVEDNSQKTKDDDTILNNFNEKIEEFAKIKIYPNPAQEILNIETTGLNIENLQVTVVDYMGKTVQSIKPKTEVIKLEVSYLKAGNYIIYVNDGLQSIVEQFIKVE